MSLITFNKTLSEEKRLSRIVSIDTDSLYEFIRDDDLDCTVRYKVLNGFIIPELSVYTRVNNSNISEVYKLVDLIKDKFNWKLSSIGIFQGNPKDIDLTAAKVVGYNSLTEINPKLLIDRLISICIRPIALTNVRIDEKSLIDDLSDKPGSRLFHITDARNVNSILESGLIPKDSYYNNFKYEHMVHVLRSLGGNMVKLRGGKLVVPKNFRCSNPVLLEIHDFSELDLDFYLDPATPEDGLVTDFPMPPECISVVDPIDYKKLFKQYDIHIAKFQYFPAYFDELDGIKFDKSINSLKSFSINFEYGLNISTRFSKGRNP